MLVPVESSKTYLTNSNRFPSYLDYSSIIEVVWTCDNQHIVIDVDVFATIAAEVNFINISDIQIFIYTNRR